MTKFKISGVQKVIGKLQARAKAAGRSNVTVAVGFAASYALFVHEKVGMKLAGQPRSSGRGFYWDPQGQAQAKFLEEPARTLQPEFRRILKMNMARGVTLSQALLIIGLRLQREAQLKVPVDTGMLKASAFTRYL